MQKLTRSRRVLRLAASLQNQAAGARSFCKNLQSVSEAAELHRRQLITYVRMFEEYREGYTTDELIRRALDRPSFRFFPPLPPVSLSLSFSRFSARRRKREKETKSGNYATRVNRLIYSVPTLHVERSCVVSTKYGFIIVIIMLILDVFGQKKWKTKLK